MFASCLIPLVWYHKMTGNVTIWVLGQIMESNITCLLFELIETLFRWTVHFKDTSPDLKKVVYKVRKY
jgi:hypothetical protein